MYVLLLYAYVLQYMCTQVKYIKCASQNRKKEEETKATLGAGSRVLCEIVMILCMFIEWCI